MSYALVPFPILDGFAALKRRMDRWRSEIGAPDWTGVIWPEMLGTSRLLRAQLPQAEWTALRGFLRSSELATVALEDPMTRWSWERPRGQRADAELTDMVYGHASQRRRIAEATPLGQDVHQAVYNLPSLVALRERLTTFRRLFRHDHGPEPASRLPVDRRWAFTLGRARGGGASAGTLGGAGRRWPCAADAGQPTRGGTRADHFARVHEPAAPVWQLRHRELRRPA